MGRIIDPTKRTLFQVVVANHGSSLLLHDVAYNVVCELVEGDEAVLDFCTSREGDIIDSCRTFGRLIRENSDTFQFGCLEGAGHSLKLSREFSRVSTRSLLGGNTFIYGCPVEFDFKGNVTGGITGVDIRKEQAAIDHLQNLVASVLSATDQATQQQTDNNYSLDQYIEEYL